MNIIKKLKLTFIFFLLLNILTFFSNVKANFSLDLCSESAILIDSSNGQILYSKNENQKMYPASTTKILTAILAIENLDLSEKVSASHDAIYAIPSGYSNAAIQVGEELTVQELLTVFLVHSANEAGYILAEHISGSISNFSALMNKKANEIGCQNTNFTNPSGLHDENHYSTAYDLSLIAKYCMKNETFRNIVSMPYCNIKATEKYQNRYFLNTNEMLNSKSKYYDENIIGIKTGFTSQAKNCLISGYKKNNIELISVVLGATQTASNGLSGKYSDTKTLFDYGINNFSQKNIASKGQVITQITIDHASPKTKHLELLLEKDITIFVENSMDISLITPEIKLNNNITAPIAKDSILGTVTYNVNGIPYTSNILASNSVESILFLEIILRISFALIILFIVYNLMYNKKKKTKRRKKSSQEKYLYGRIKY